MLKHQLKHEMDRDYLVYDPSSAKNKTLSLQSL